MAELDVSPVAFRINANPVARVGVAASSGAQVILVPTPGSQGPAGPAGTGFTHTQTSPAATWTITNPLGRYPNSVSVYIGNELVDADIETPDISTIAITFASPQSGRAEII